MGYPERDARVPAPPLERRGGGADHRVPRRPSLCGDADRLAGPSRDAGSRARPRHRLRSDALGAGIGYAGRPDGGRRRRRGRAGAGARLARGRRGLHRQGGTGGPRRRPSAGGGLRPERPKGRRSGGRPLRDGHCRHGRPRQEGGAAPRGGGCREARRAAAEALRRRQALRAHHPAGDGHQRKGRDHPARVHGHVSAGARGARLQEADSGGGPARVLVAHPQGAARQGEDRRLQPLPVRGHPGAERVRDLARRRDREAVRDHQRVRAQADGAGRGGPEVLPEHLEGRAEGAPAGSPRRPRQALEVQPRRPEVAGALGRFPGGLREDPRPDGYALGALAHHPGGQEVVPELLGGTDPSEKMGLEYPKPSFDPKKVRIPD